jgi:hypothetical protein
LVVKFNKAVFAEEFVVVVLDVVAVPFERVEAASEVVETLADELASLRATAVLMPTTSPRKLTNGPPELPDEIAASV